jgi:hypothetical protein
VAVINRARLVKFFMGFSLNTIIFCYLSFNWRHIISHIVTEFGIQFPDNLTAGLIMGDYLQRDSQRSPAKGECDARHSGVY